MTFPVKLRVNLASFPSVTAVTGFPSVSTDAEMVTTGNAGVVALTLAEASLAPTELMAETR